MILSKGTPVMVIAPPEYPDVAPAKGVIVGVPQGVFAMMGGVYQVQDEDGEVWPVHRNYMKEPK